MIPDTERDALADRHELQVIYGGDGYNEPFGESYDCSCGQAIGSWVQVTPDCEGRPELDRMLSLHADHVSSWLAEHDARVILDYERRLIEQMTSRPAKADFRAVQGGEGDE